MKISLKWLNDYVDIKNEDVNLLADKITKAGVKIEKINQVNLNNLVIGKVLECNPHPDSDHLHVCMVDVSDKTLQIVCGAPNIEVNQKVIVALEGAVLPGNFTIKKSTIRGVESNGMICALFELGLEEENLEAGIYVLNDDAVVGEDPIKYLGYDDIVYDLDLNPNRNDCLSHLGFAYEAAAVLNKPINSPNTKTNDISENIKDNFSLNVDTLNCPMYLARMVKDVKIGPSPDFIKQRLESAGMRSINNVVDISNYIMLEYGQPLHFFDKDKLGDKIIVRMAKDNEKVTTLDEIERILIKDDIVITNETGVVAVAGVMGALNTDVDDNTKNILIESAIFNPYNVRYTSIRLGLRSESSLRFEHTLNYEYTMEAVNRACYLLEKYADGKVLSGTISHDKVEKTKKIQTITLDKINKVLGITIETSDVKTAFDKLGFTYKVDNDTFEVEIPNRRMDVAIKEDLIEEVGRLYGYENIVGKVPSLEVKRGSYEPKIAFRKSVSKKMRSLGLYETRTYTLINEKDIMSFAKEKAIKVLLPMSSDKNTARTSIIPSLLKVYDYNKARNINDINIYEIANVYYDESYEEELKLGFLMEGKYLYNTWNKEEISASFYNIKGILENLLNYLGFENRYTFLVNTDVKELHPGVSANILIDQKLIGFIGKINPSLYKDNIFVCEISLEKIFNMKPSKIKYPNLSKYPEITKDVAFILDKDITAGEVIKCIKSINNSILKDITVFDLYVGDNIDSNKKQLAFSLRFNSLDRTLIEEEVDNLFKKIIEKVKSEFNCTIRDK